jgi:hypothetical protein
MAAFQSGRGNHKMIPKFNSFFLSFDVFSIEFIVDLELSAELTYRFSEYDKEFLFAAGEIWINTSTGRELVLPVARPQNLLQLLENISKNILGPSSVVGLENLIEKGGWSFWMRGYDHRMHSESTTSQDELTCDLLLPFSVVEGSRGRLIIYSCLGCPVVEVVTHSEGEELGVVFWTQYDPPAVSRSLAKIKEEMSEAVALAVRNFS